jgi:hypothetical protein
MPVYDPRYPIGSQQNWYGGGAAGIMPPAHGVGPSYSNYFQQASWLPDFFGGVDPLARGALDDPNNYQVGYGQIAGRMANPNSNLYRYILAQAGRLHSNYDYASLSDPALTWSQYAGQQVPQLEQQFRQLAPEQRGERQMFAQGGGRYLG